MKRNGNNSRNKGNPQSKKTRIKMSIARIGKINLKEFKKLARRNDISIFDRAKKLNIGVGCFRKIAGRNNIEIIPMRYERILRIIKTASTGQTEVYGITIPPKYVRKYNILHKKFTIRVSPQGKFILYTKIRQ